MPGTRGGRVPEADRRLERDDHSELAGQLGIANAKLAYRHFVEVSEGARWQALAAQGAAPQRPLWASTSTKNPAYRDTMYVEELVGPQTVNTMPIETIDAFEDHGVVRGTTVSEGWDEADALFAAIARAEHMTQCFQSGLFPFKDSEGRPSRTPV